MTYDERMKAFDMRIRGRNWGEIAAALNYAEGASVERDIRKCVSGRRKQYRCAYPALRKVISSEYFGSISAFAESCGIKYSTMYAVLLGNRKPSEKNVKKICERTRLSPEEAFRRGRTE